MDMRVLVLAGGGVGHVSGGVGTMMLYLADEWTRRGESLRLRVRDTRGEGGFVSGSIAFAIACADVVVSRSCGRLDLVHAHMTTRGSVIRKGFLACLARGLGVPVVMHMHGADFASYCEAMPAWRRALVGFALRRASHVVVLGDMWRRFMVDRLGVAPSRVSVVLNGVPAPVPRAKRPVLEGAPVRILFLGRIGDRKGVPELLQALALPRLARLDWQATIAGDGEVDRMAAMALGLDLSERVDFPGWVDREAAQRLLRHADILVLPSHHEALPVAVIEAMAHEVAVVTTPVGALPEILCDGRDASLVEPGDVVALARALARLVESAARRRRLAEAGYHVFLERLDVNATAGRMLLVYRSVLKSVPQDAASKTGRKAAGYGV